MSHNVAMKLRTRIVAKGRPSDFIEGQVLASTLFKFKTSSSVEVVHTSMHLYHANGIPKRRESIIVLPHVG